MIGRSRYYISWKLVLINDTSIMLLTPINVLCTSEEVHKLSLAAVCNHVVPHNYYMYYFKLFTEVCGYRINYKVLSSLISSR